MCFQAHSPAHFLQRQRNGGESVSWIPAAGPHLQPAQLDGLRYLQDVVALDVTEVPDSDLCAHIPAVEGAPWELKATHLKQHVGYGRQGIPLQLQLPEPLIPGREAELVAMGPSLWPTLIPPKKKASEKECTKKTPFQVLISKFIPPGEVN